MTHEWFVHRLPGYWELWFDGTDGYANIRVVSLSEFIELLMEIKK